MTRGRGTYMLDQAVCKIWDSIDGADLQYIQVVEVPKPKPDPAQPTHLLLHITPSFVPPILLNISQTGRPSKHAY